MGDKPKKPKLPKAAPQDLKDFISCKVARVELSPGQVDWLPIPISPEVTFKPGKAAGEVDLELKLPLKDDPITVTAKVNADGQLELDPTNLPFGKDGANDWVKQLNDWLKSRNRKLGPAEIKDGKLVLVKRALAAADRQGAFLPNVPAWEKGAGVALVAFATVAGVAMMPEDTTTTISMPVAVTESQTDEQATTTAEATTTQAPTTTAAPTVPIDQLVAVVNDGCWMLRHGTGQSFPTLIFTADPQYDGEWILTLGTTPTGPITGTGTMAGGLGQVQSTIFAFGTYDDPTLMPVGGQNADLAAISDLFPLQVGPDEMQCDPSSLQAAPVPDESADDVPAEPPAEGGAAAPEPESPQPESPQPESSAGQTTTQMVDVEETTEAGAPWSLLLIPGTMMFVGGGWYYDEQRRRDAAWNNLASMATDAPVLPPDDVGRIGGRIR